MKTAVRGWAGILIALFLASSAAAQTIELDVHAREAWLPEQTISGTASGIEGGTLSVGSREYAFEVDDSGFAVDVKLHEGINEIVACSGVVCSDTARWTIRYDVQPEIFAYAEVSGRDVELHANLVEAPGGPAVSFAWSADADNPTGISLVATGDSVASATIPEGAAVGEYYFDVVVTDSAGHEGEARTFVTVTDEGIDPFDIRDEHASWIDKAIVYEVTPYIFERNGKWRDVTARLDEISRIGVNTLWIQPVFEAQMEGPGTAGQGYGIVDYFELREDLGTEEELRELVRSAKEDYGMRVLFDFVPSHTSIQHPYAQDVLERQEESPYYSFYMTEPDDAPYSQHYHTDVEPFVYYFWEELVILNWDNPEVYQMMREAGQKWIEEFDIDGYRIDAVWGVNARTPDAMQKWRLDLKRIKPEIFLLGEAPAARSLNFDGRFDAAYDWYAELDWVSHWTWQTSYDENELYTIFNTWSEFNRATLLRTALTNRGQGYHPNAKIFRFMENNDTERFIAWHSIEQTKMAATMLFSLPGIPMIYNGQEIGARNHPYETNFVYAEGRSISSLDRDGLYPHYQYLTWLRSSIPALYGDRFDEVPITTDYEQDRVFAYRRTRDDVHVIGVVNLVEEGLAPALRLPTARMRISDSQTYYVTDLMTGDVEIVPGSELDEMVREIPGFTTHLFAISSEELNVPVANEPDTEVPKQVALAQNYPNPFNPSTRISFELPEARSVTLRVFDVLGREVTALVDGYVTAGKHTLRFDGRGLASGVYFYRLDTGAQTLTRQMLLTK